MKILSPAKINLMLRILGQRNDGYHLLQTYFQLINWGDEIQFNMIESNEINILGQFGSLAKQDNLIYKAAKLLLPYKNINKGIKITVDKKIPQGSGLGGGSSNAGTTLRILNEIWKCGLSKQKLQKIALKLGADVPIFVLNKSAMATGIGENLIPYQIKNYYYVLIFPKTGIATADIFNNNSLIKNQKEINIDKVNKQEYWTNTCLPIVLNNYPEVADIYNKASKIAPIFMSGTGSTFFSYFDSSVKANRFIDQCPINWNLQLTHSRNI